MTPAFSADDADRVAAGERELLDVLGLRPSCAAPTSVWSGGGLGRDGHRFGQRAGRERKFNRLRTRGVQLDAGADALS